MAKLEAVKIEHFFSPRRKDVCVQSELTMSSIEALESSAGAGESASLLEQVHSHIH